MTHTNVKQGGDTLVRVLTEEEWEIVRSVLGSSMVVLVTPEGAKAIRDRLDVNLDDLNGLRVDYTFGGEADIWVDVVHDENHLFVGYLIGD